MKVQHIVKVAARLKGAEILTDSRAEAIKVRDRVRVEGVWECRSNGLRLMVISPHEIEDRKGIVIIKTTGVPR